MISEKTVILGLLVISIVATSCSTLGISPSVRISGDNPLVARDLTQYENKRAVLLAINEPAHEKGLGRYFADILFTELLKAAPFEQVAHRPQQFWYGLQSEISDEFSTAAALGADLGFDIAIAGQVDKFIYSRNSDSMLIVTIWLFDSSTGELVHAQRLSARGVIGYLPPFWDPSLNKAASQDDIFTATANTFVRRLLVKWHEGESDDYFADDEEYVEEPPY